MGNGKPETIRELHFYLEGKFEVLEKLEKNVEENNELHDGHMKNIERIMVKLESQQNEITEHKKDHLEEKKFRWKSIPIIGGIITVTIAVIYFIKEFVK